MTRAATSQLDHIRVARPQDALAISRIYRFYVEQTVVSFEVEAPDEAEMARRMAGLQPHFPWLVHERGGEVSGFAYAGPYEQRAAYRWSARSTVYLDASAHRQGIGAALYGAVIAALGLQGYHRLFGGITLPNAASVGLHEAMGFRQVGVFGEVGYKLGAWRDVGLWALTLTSAGGEPAPPLPFSDAIFRQAVSDAQARRG